jgi:hypothetical protein
MELVSSGSTYHIRRSQWVPGRLMATTTFNSRAGTVNITIGQVKWSSRRFLPTSRLSSGTATVP